MHVERMRQCEDIGALTKELDIHRRMLYRWSDHLDPIYKSEWPTPQNSRESTLREVRPTQAGAGRENSGTRFFRRCLAKSRGADASEDDFFSCKLRGVLTNSKVHLRRGISPYL